MNKTAFPFLPSIYIMLLESIIIVFDEMSTTLKSIPSGNEKRLSFPIYCYIITNQTLIPLLITLKSDNFHWQINLILHTSRIAFIENLELAIRLATL